MITRQNTEMLLNHRFGVTLRDYCYLNRDYYGLTAIDIDVLSSINPRSLASACLQAMFRIRYSDLQKIDLAELLVYNTCEIVAGKNKMNLSLRLNIRLELLDPIPAVAEAYRSKLVYDIYRYDLKLAIQSLHKTTWYKGRNVSHFWRKTIATSMFLNGVKKKDIAEKLGHFDLNSQKAYIDDSV